MELESELGGVRSARRLSSIGICPEDNDDDILWCGCFRVFFVCVLPLARALGTYFPELFLL